MKQYVWFLVAWILWYQPVTYICTGEVCSKEVFPLWLQGEKSPNKAACEQRLTAVAQSASQVIPVFEQTVQTTVNAALCLPEGQHPTKKQEAE